VGAAEAALEEFLAGLLRRPLDVRNMFRHGLVIFLWPESDISKLRPVWRARKGD
jgi:hypothetical protein